MRLTEEFDLPVAPADAWVVLGAVDKAVHCIPGARVSEVHGHEYRGSLKVAVGRIDADFRGRVRFVERDGPARTAKLRAEAKEVGGYGHASAAMAMSIRGTEVGCRVSLEILLSLGGALDGVGKDAVGGTVSKLIRQFAECLERDLLAGLHAAASGEDAQGPGADEAGDQETHSMIPEEGLEPPASHEEPQQPTPEPTDATVEEPVRAEEPGSSTEEEEGASQEPDFATSATPEPADATPEPTGATIGLRHDLASGESQQSEVAAAGASLHAAPVDLPPHDHTPELVEIHSGDELRKWGPVGLVLAAAGIVGWFIARRLRGAR